jgi:hypothetical protein
MAVVKIDGENRGVDLLPDECSRCHKSISVLVRSCGIEFFFRGQEYLQAVFKCPACKMLFLGTYKVGNLGWELQFVEPTDPVKRSFGPIDALSPQFVKIFNQASAAEAHMLDEIAGLAYRKSLEFLIKDYCISRAPEHAEAIKKDFLGTVIRDRLEDKKIQMAAQRATWLGNDETHYIREWVNHDVQDLKNLIRITVNGISEELEYDDYMKSFEAKPKVVATSNS